MFGQTNPNINEPMKVSTEYVHGDILIKFKSIPGQRQSIEVEKNQLINQYQSKVVKQWRTKAEHWKLDTLQANFNLLQIIDSLNANTFVEYAEPNYKLRANVTPNDPQLGDQWALNNTGQDGGTPNADINAPEAWDITTGDTNIIVGVLDSGIDYNHPDLEDNIWTNWDEIPNNGIDDDNNGYVDDIHGWDFYNNDNDPMDDFYHGTHVAGTIGAVSNNGIGIGGVAWNVRMMALKFLDNFGEGPTSAAISAVEYATENGASLTNNSWGGGSYTQALYDAIAEADAANVLFVAAAGNDTKDNDKYSYFPSNYELPNILTVASTDRNDTISTFSNWGLNTVDITAPGTSILSTLPNNTYGILNGTSMATPHVSGAVVLAWAQFPGFSNQQIKNQILGSGDQKDRFSGLVSSGSRLNLYNAVVDTNMIAIDVDNREVDFGALLIGNQSEEKEILISNILDEQILIDSIVCDTGFLITLNSTFTNFIPSFTLNPNQVDTVVMVFNPNSEGVYNKKCKIYYRTNGLISKTITIFLDGYGAVSGTIIDNSEVSGAWLKANSPYYINNDIYLRQNNNLSIEAGVEIIFAGPYKMEVEANAALTAIGTINDSIAFKPINIDIGWTGIRLLESGNDDKFQYCSFSYGNKVGIEYAGADEDQSGGAIAAKYSCPTIKNCLFNNNYASSFGGALAIKYPNIYSQEDLFVIDSCKFINNSTGNFGGGGVLIESLRNVIVKNSVFINNNSEQGTLNIQCGGDQENSIGAIVYNCRFENNITVYGGSAIYISRFENICIHNNLMFNNYDYCPASMGGAVYIRIADRCLMYHNTIVDNAGNPSNSLFLNESNKQEILNNIFWNDDFEEILVLYPESDPIVRSNILFNGIYEDNIYEPPDFIGGTYQLRSTSPAIDTAISLCGIQDEDSRKFDIGYTSDIGLSLFDSEIDFGKVGLGYTKSEYFYLTNTNNEAIVIDSITVGENLLLQEDYINLLEENVKLELNITAQPLTEGVIIDTVTIHTSYLSNGKMVIPCYIECLNGNLLFGAIIDTLKTINSPYIAIDDIYIPMGSQVVIEKDVEIFFDDGTTFDINGSLVVNGEIGEPVLFSSSSDSVYFNGINFNYLSKVLMKNAVIKNYIKIVVNNQLDRAEVFFRNTKFINGKNSIVYPEEYYNVCVNRSIASFTSCLFEGNVSSITFLNNYGANTSLINCIFRNNIGYIIGNQSGDFNVVNTTITDNYLSEWSGNKYLFFSKGSSIAPTNTYFVNSSIYDDDDFKFYINSNYGENTFSFQNTLIRGGESVLDGFNYEGAIFDFDPQFSDTLGHLSTTSPCIDAGDSTSNTTNFDIEGNPRVLNNTIDIGAFEWGNYWTGNEDANWLNPLNWKDNLVPDQTSILTIPNSQFYINWPVIQSSQKASKLFLKEGAVLEINNGGVLEVGE